MHCRDRLGAADSRLYVKGHIVAIDPRKQLQYTAIAPDMKLPDVPESYLTVIYKLEGREDGTVNLRLSMGDFNAVGAGKKRYEEMIATGGRQCWRKSSSWRSGNRLWR